MAAPILAATIPPRTIRLRDGASYRLRVLGPADTALVTEMFTTLSAESIRARYGYLIRDMTPERAHRLVLTDSIGDISLGLCEVLEDGREKLWAIGRLVHAADNRSAECAFLVHDAKRRLGIAARLLFYVRVIGRRRGLSRLFAQVRWENRAMLAVFRQNGGILHFSPAGDAVEVDIPLRTSKSLFDNPSPT